jgi:hypothetical protein
LVTYVSYLVSCNCLIRSVYVEINIASLEIGIVKWLVVLVVRGIGYVGWIRTSGVICAGNTIARISKRIQCEKFRTVVVTCASDGVPKCYLVRLQL